ncbi:hypothetical protein DIPPA_24391 [Diplonema papillatum]|nr:hypothetical protein DIPPA_24391 [Diplonema papillatum]
MSSLLAPVNWLLEAMMIKDVEPDPQTDTAVRLNWALIQQQDSVCSNKIIAVLSGTDSFKRLSAQEGAMLAARDEEDEEKLWRGIQLSISRGILPEISPPSVTKVDVENKTPAEVAGTIVQQLPKSHPGSVVVLQGMSGTGKGTTTATLLELLPNSASWSNGNVFRSLTLLAVSHCKNKGLDVDTQLQKVLTSENVAKWAAMLSCEKSPLGKYDIMIHGLGLNTSVSAIQNTLLKEPFVAKHIPTVAEQTQGEVIKFAAASLKKMAEDGQNVVLEGRAATVQYVPTPYRFELMLKDIDLLGKRRAAQRIMATIYEENKSKPTPPQRVEIIRRAKALCEQWAPQSTG